MAKELAPIVLSIAAWGSKLVKKCVLFQCDNMSVVQALKKGSAKDYLVMQLLCSLWFLLPIMMLNLHVFILQGQPTQLPTICHAITCHAFFP